MLRRVRIVFGVAIAVLWCAGARADPRLGQRAPALIVHELNGGTFNLAAERGRVVLVNVWATWCTPCRKEMPTLNAFYEKFHAWGVDLLGLADDNARRMDKVRMVMKQFAYPAAMMTSAEENGFGRPRAVPMTYVFDRQGILRAKLWPGGRAVAEQTLEDTVVPLLARDAAGK